MTRKAMLKVGPTSLLVVTLCFALSGTSGCAPVTPRTDASVASDLSQLARQVRPADPSRQPFTFSNEARAIEEDLGVGRKTSETMAR